MGTEIYFQLVLSSDELDKRSILIGYLQLLRSWGPEEDTNRLPSSSPNLMYN